MIDEMMKKEGWRSHALSILRSKFESEERHQEVVYVNNLLKREETEEHTNDKDKNNGNTDFQKDY
jgi:hypothetical protein